MKYTSPMIGTQGIKRVNTTFAIFAICLGLSASFLTTRSGALNGWMPLLAIPFYFTIVLSSVKMIGKTQNLQEQDSKKNSNVNRGPEKRDLLLLLRFFAATLVFVMHSRIVFNVNPKDVSKQHAWLFFSPAWLGMAIFFTLSGYLMGKIFSSGKYIIGKVGITQYYKSRFFRIFPAAFFVMLILLAFLYPQWLTNSQFVIRILTFTFNGINGPGGFGAFWSLTTEIQFYLLVPAFVLLSQKFLSSNTQKIISIILLYAAGTALRLISVLHYGNGFKFWNPYIYTPLYENLDIFLSGLILSTLDKPELGKVLGVLKKAWPYAILILYVSYTRIAWLAIIESEHLAIGFFIVALPACASFISLFVILGMEESSLTWTKKSRVLWPVIKTLGPITFCYYMLHSSIMIAIQQAFPGRAYNFKILIAIPFILGISSFTYYGIESKFHKWKR